MNIKTVGSVCSGIEAASVAWEPLGIHFQWFSEIADFPSRVLKAKYPNTPNLGDMNDIPDKILAGTIDAPDFICGGTPCQAFSFAGWQNGLNDDRGNLTLKFVDIIKANDEVRLRKGFPRTIVFWENVEGVLTDKTNAFGCLVSSLAGLNNPIENKRWPNSGFIRGKTRNVAWRVLDAKYFGLPQQRKRLYLIAGGTDFFPENVLLEDNAPGEEAYPKRDLVFEKDGQDDVKREFDGANSPESELFLQSSQRYLNQKWTGIKVFGGNVYLFPHKLEQLKRCNVIGKGLFAGQNLKGRFVPSHALCMALTPGQVKQVIELDGIQLTQYLRGETLQMASSDGWGTVCYKGVNIGWYKAVDGILKNHFPKGLRI